LQQKYGNLGVPHSINPAKISSYLLAKCDNRYIFVSKYRLKKVYPFFVNGNSRRIINKLPEMGRSYIFYNYLALSFDQEVPRPILKNILHAW